MRLWIAILLLLDAGLVLWHEQRIQPMLPRWPVKWIALIEASIASALITWHFWRYF